MSHPNTQADERVTVCANCNGKLYQTADPNNIHWYHEGTGDVRCPTRFAEPRAAVTAPRGDVLLSDNDATLLAHAITIAREVQEFIWADCYLSLRPYDAEGWRRLFQKRVDCIAEIDLTKHGGLAALRKRLLQQAALSIKALALVNRWAKTDPVHLSTGSDGSDLRDAVTASPTPAESACSLCGHQGMLAADGATCITPVSICSDDYHGTRSCGCKCRFASAERTRVEGEQRLLMPEELADIERFQKQRRKSPVVTDAWLYVAEIDRLLTHIRLDREQLENEIFQDATDPAFTSDSARQAAEEIAANYEVHKDRCHSNERYPSPPCDCGAIEEVAAIIERHAAAPADNDAESKGESDAWCCN